MKKLALVAVLAVGTLALPGCAASLNHQAHTNCKVLKKETFQHVSGDNGSTSTSFERRLDTTCGAFNVGDSIAGGFSSYDTWNRVEEGKTYDIETGGFRMGMFDSFPTVVKVTPK